MWFLPQGFFKKKNHKISNQKLIGFLHFSQFDWLTSSDLKEVRLLSLVTSSHKVRQVTLGRCPKAK